MINNNECYTLDEVAKIFRTTRQNILNWRKKGIIKTVNIGGRVLVRRKEIERIFYENERKN